MQVLDMCLKEVSKNRTSYITKSAFSCTRNILDYISFSDLCNFYPLVILLLSDLQNAYYGRKSKFQNEFYCLGET